MSPLRGVARRSPPRPTLATLAAAGLRVVAAAAFRPRGRFDVRPLRARPLRALRGGEGAFVAAYAVRDGLVDISVFAAGAAPPGPSERDWAMSVARALVGVDDDPSEFLALASRHPLVERLARAQDCRLERSVTVFESFARAVIEQLVTTDEASAAIRRLFALAGEPIAGTGLSAAPLPRAVLAVPPFRLHAIGVGARRAAPLREGARRGAALERLREVAPQVAVGMLESLPGVGPWTANLVARSALGWTDAVPVGDFHAHDVISEALTGERGSDAVMLEALAPFRPHRARVVKLITSGTRPSYRQRPRPRVDPHRREPWRY